MLLLILALRMGLVGITLAHPEGGVLIDSRSYLKMGEELQRTGVFSQATSGDVHWPPGYAAFLALVQGLTGTDFAGVIAVQLLATGVACLALARIGAMIGVPKAGMVAAYVYALSPNAAMWSLTIMSESIFAVLLILGLWAWVRARSRDGIGWPVATGLLLGLSSMVRPIGLPIIGLWGAVEVWRKRPSLGWRALIVRLILILGGFGLVIGPWILRNRLVLGEILISRGPWRSLILFNLASVVAEVEGISRDEAAQELDGSVESWGDVWSVIREHPGEFAGQQMRGVLRSAIGVETGAWARVVGLELENQGSFGILELLLRGRLAQAWLEARGELSDSRGALLILTGVAVLHSLGSYGAAGGLLLPWNRVDSGSRALAVALTLTVVYLLVAPGAVGQARFRVAAEPYLALLAGMGADRWGEALARRGAKKREEAAAPKA